MIKYRKWEFGLAPIVIQHMIDKSDDQEDIHSLKRVLRVFELLIQRDKEKEVRNASFNT